MNHKQLERAVRARADELLDIARYEEVLARARLMRDVAELALVAARLVGGKTLHRAFGAPGDWGYGTPIGDALAAPEDAPTSKNRSEDAPPSEP